MARLSESTPEFRRGLKALKKAGIIDVDISAAKPWHVRKAGPRGGTYTLKELLSKYDDIVSEKATAVKVSETKKKEYKKLGFEVTKQGRIIVPHAATEKVKVKKGDFYTEDLQGIRRTAVNVPYHNLEQYIRDLKEKEKSIDASKKRGRYFAFRFYGGHSIVYSNLDLLLDVLEQYENISGPINRRSARDMNEAYRNLEIVETTKYAWEKSMEMARARAKAHKKPKRGSSARALANAERKGPAAAAAYRKKQAESARKARAKMSPAKKAEYKQNAVARAKKSRRRQQGK